MIDYTTYNLVVSEEQALAIAAHPDMDLESDIRKQIGWESAIGCDSQYTVLYWRKRMGLGKGIWVSAVPGVPKDPIYVVADLLFCPLYGVRSLEPTIPNGIFSGRL